MIFPKQTPENLEMIAIISVSVCSFVIVLCLIIILVCVCKNGKKLKNEVPPLVQEIELNNNREEGNYHVELVYKLENHNKDFPEKQVSVAA